MTHPDDAITFEATTTIDDVIAAHRHLTSKPTKAAKRRRTWRLAIYPALFFVPMFGVVLGSNNPTASLEIFMEADFWLHLMSYIIVVGVLAFGMRLLWRLLNQAVIRSTFVAMRRHNPGVAPGDPRFPLTRTYRFDETGFSTKTEDDEIWESWSRVTGLDETATLLIVTIGAGTGYPLPKAQLTSDLRERLHLYIAGRASSKWPF